MIDGNPTVQNSLVVSICGPSGAGKSQLAKATARALGEDIAARVPVDYFFVPRSGDMSLPDFFARPLQYDWSLLRERLALPVGSATSTPDADFDAFRRRALRDGLRFMIRPVLICDAMEPYPASDLVVLLDVPMAVRHHRLAERDFRWGTRVYERLDHLEATWQAVSASIVPDMTLDGTAALGRTADRLADVIRNMRSGE